MPLFFGSAQEFVEIRILGCFRRTINSVLVTAIR
jgi:hypothetical protein